MSNFKTMLHLRFLSVWKPYLIYKYTGVYNPSTVYKGTRYYLPNIGQRNPVIIFKYDEGIIQMMDRDRDIGIPFLVWMVAWIKGVKYA